MARATCAFLMSSVDASLRPALIAKTTPEIWTNTHTLMANYSSTLESINTDVIVPPLQYYASNANYVSLHITKLNTITFRDRSHYLAATATFVADLVEGLPFFVALVQFIRRDYRQKNTFSIGDAEKLL